ncbi:DUF6499 domain-containing protein [Brevundimonas sp.]|uniref:transcriptional regulator domain-containing protein n=1 Tax=Brevundimonas sp. TaxID=1871086 RepID=UPI0034225227
MKPDTSQWRDRKSYDYFDALETEGLAWECLRRCVPYQQHYANLVIERLETAPLSLDAERRWGLRFRRETEPISPIPRRPLVDECQFRGSRAHASEHFVRAADASAARRPWRSTP